MSTLILDLETENYKYAGNLASPKHPLNYVVAVGEAFDGGPVATRYYENKEASADWFNIPDDVTLIVAHNAPFEIEWLLTTQREKFMRFLQRGGRVFCTAYAEYLLTSQQSQYPSLNETAPKYGGTHKVDGIKILWDQGTLTSQIDRDLLLDYLGGPSGDIENTRKVFIGQVAALQAQGMWNMALVRMEGLLFSALAMHYGLHIDRDGAYKRLREQEERLAIIKDKLHEYQRNIPDYVGFKFTSDYHMSAWLFGGPIKYRVQDTWFEDDNLTPKYVKVDSYEFDDSETIPVSWFEDKEIEYGVRVQRQKEAVLTHGPITKYRAGKNKGQPKVVRVDSTTIKTKWYDRQHVCAPLFDLSTMPSDIRKEWLRDFSGKRFLADNTPVYSTGADSLEVIAKHFSNSASSAVVDLLLEYAKIDKDIGTYYLREECDDEGNVVKTSGMLQFLTDENIIYHGLNHTATVTTRLSSARPNMQNTTRADKDDEGHYKSEVKRNFTSRYDDPVWLAWALGNGQIDQKFADLCLANIAAGVENGCIIEADYSALEVVVLAAFSNDPVLCAALVEGTDMHCLRLSRKLREPYDEVFKKCHDKTHPEHSKYKLMRTNIKPKAFAYQYGATAAGIAYATGGTVQEAQEFIDVEKALFPGVEAWFDAAVIASVEQSAWISRELKEDGTSWRVFKRGVWVSPGGTRYEFREYPKTEWSDGQKLQYMAFKPTQMRNYPIQGEAGFFVQGIAGLIARWMVQNNFFEGRMFPINTVHDALYFDCHRSILEGVAPIIKQIMESVPTYFAQLGYDLRVPFPVEVEAGPSMLIKEKVA